MINLIKMKGFVKCFSEKNNCISEEIYYYKISNYTVE